MTARQTGQIVKSYGRRYVVKCFDGTVYDCTTRGKKTNFACGDRVELTPQNTEQAVIEATLPRQSLLYRSDAFRSKLIAANVTQLVIVLAPVPTFSEMLLNRCLVAAEAAGIAVLIALNKSDLPEAAEARERLKAWEALGYRVLMLSATTDIAPLRPYLAGHTSVLVGQSGMGKSTLTNALLPEARARVGEISVALDSGRHTTTHAELYDLDADSHLIDSPGLQEFGLHHLVAADLIYDFPEFRGLVGKCRFHNCTHRVEPSCALIAATQAGEATPDRLAFFQRLMDELAPRTSSRGGR